MAPSSPAQRPLSWTVVGSGAIGSLAACRLKQAGYAVSLHLKQPRSHTIDFAGSQLHFPAATPPFTAVLIPVKSYAVIDAVQSLLPHLTSNAQLVLSHNGMGTLEHILPLLAPSQGLWFLTTTHGALKQQHSLLHTGQGQSVLSALNVAAKAYTPAVLPAMETALGPVTLVDDITPFLWQKLAINAAINPLTAIYNCRNGALLQAQFEPLLTAAITEVQQVAAACGVVMDDSLQQKVLQVIAATAENFSSMQQDIANKRRTEIEAINGYVVQQAARFGIAVPHNNNMLAQVLRLSSACS
ncbi:ketopantoate reductase family protein [Rheinheimera nanhaiensis]|uniref:2-dehydropantoate 2-reductase n=1 Tax=Rheinheimera nanhaiensis E407-8 TaxID=562729 RepID=I1E2H7_9GAMM|nr:ketopantoate reductase family protein [Rheinheimera nanhaiensis]GAB60505.1 2-dehydropantoate 2-reductase [Rheinheimera nanhaiensis E407-8]